MQKIKRIIAISVIAVLIAVLAIVANFVPPRRLLPALRIPKIGEGELRLHFLDVGQGDCTIVEFSDGELFIIDAGAESFVQENKLVRYIKGLKPTRLNLILTHADSDHYEGFGAILDVFEIEKFYLPVLASSSEGYAALMEKIERAGCEKDTLTRYSTIEREGGYFVCLSPYSFGETDENEASAVLYLEYGGVNAVFCGDIGRAREQQLEREYHLDSGIFNSGSNSVRLDGVEILKVAHHGSANSSSKEWLNLLRPKAAIVSCGRGNGYSFPAQEAISRLKAASPNGEIYRTDELGDIIISIKGGEYSVLVRGE